MRKVVLGVAVSLDNFIEGPKGEYDWCFTDQDYGMSGFLKSIDAIFMGRKSYDLANSIEAPNPWKGVMTYVFSNSMKTTPAGCKLVSGDIVKQVNDIKNESGKDIWLFGGAELTSSFMMAGLIDELWLAVHPILLGSGKPLFQGITTRIKTRLLESRPYDTGLVSLKYQLLH